MLCSGHALLLLLFCTDLRYLQCSMFELGSRGKLSSLISAVVLKVTCLLILAWSAL